MDLSIKNARGGAVSVRALDYYDGYVYLGGVFTHLSGGGVSNVYARNVARVALDGRPDRAWNPELSGSVQAVAVSGNGAFYAGGHFTRAHGNDRAWYAAKFSTAPGAAQDTSFDFQPSTVSAWKYQQTISAAGKRVFIGGSEHSLFHDTGSNLRTSGSLMLSNGGDLQASTISANGVTDGRHCSDGAYQDKYDWGVNLNWSRIDEIKWVGAWDATPDGENLHWTPFELSSRRKTGAWALTTDTNGNLWACGDFILSFTDSTHSQWNGGFARYDKRDNVAPEAPTFLRTSSATASTVTLTWEGVSDAVSYEILRDDRAIGSTQAPALRSRAAARTSSCAPSTPRATARPRPRSTFPRPTARSIRPTPSCWTRAPRGATALRTAPRPKTGPAPRSNSQWPTLPRSATATRASRPS